jgi:hypothetical protein
MRDIEGPRLQQFFNWVKIQQSIGISKFRFYFLRISEDSEREIRAKLDTSIFEIIEHKLDEEFVCQPYRNYLALSDDSNRHFATYMLENCHNHHSVFFNWSIDPGVLSANEKVCTNDCLLHFKHEFEFTTNYDFDEIIFPRKLNVDDYEPFLDEVKDKNSDCSNERVNQNKYSLYDYAIRLSKLLGNGKSVAMLKFENGVVFPDPDSYSKMFAKIFASCKNKTEMSVDFEMNGKKLSLVIRQNDYAYIEKIEGFQNYLKCLNDTIIQRGLFPPRLNSPYAIIVNNRLGKSIYNTDLTEFYNQHNADFFSANSLSINVPINYGFVSHFREYSDDFLVNQSYGFSYFRFDLEYYNFLAYLN